jgi:hypothetical protein
MPNWKKVIVSGSAGNLSSLSVDTFVSASTISANKITGSLHGTASQAVSSSYASSATVFPFTGSAIISGSLRVTGSLNTTGSFIVTTTGTEFQVLPGGTIIGNTSTDLHSVTGSLKVLGSITGSLFGTASLAQTASFVLNAVSASFATTASYLNPITNGYIVLTQVSASLNFVDDTAAAAGGVPLGGLYRNGNFILVRIS